MSGREHAKAISHLRSEKTLRAATSPFWSRAPRSLRSPSPLRRWYLEGCLAREEDRREMNLVTGQLRIVLSICTASTIGGWCLWCAPRLAKGASGRNVYRGCARVRDRARVKNLPARKRPRDEYEGGGGRGREEANPPRAARGKERDSERGRCSK